MRALDGPKTPAQWVFYMLFIYLPLAITFPIWFPIVFVGCAVCMGFVLIAGALKWLSRN